MIKADKATNSISAQSIETHPNATRQICGLITVILLFWALMGFSLAVLDPIKQYVLTGLLHNHQTTAWQLAVQSIHSSALPLAVYLLAILSLFGIGLWLEIRDKAVSWGLRAAPAWLFHFLLLTLVLWWAHFFMTPGHLLSGDSSAHIVRVAHVALAFRDQQYPIWNNYYFFGAPFLQFYAPLYFWIAGALALFAGNVLIGVKALLVLHYLVGAVFFYAWMRTREVNRVAALIGSIIYCGAWAHGQLIWYHGTLPLTLILAFLPLPFLLTDLILLRGRVYGWLWALLAVIIGALVNVHQIHGFFAALYLGLYVVYRLVETGSTLRIWAAFLAAAIAGVLISVPAVVPFLLEGDLVNASVDSAIIRLEAPAWDYLRKLVVWQNGWVSKAPNTAGYIGLTTVALSTFAVLLGLGPTALPTLRRFIVFAAAGAILSLCFHAGLMRDIIFVLLFFSVLAALGADSLFRRWSNRLRLPLVILVLVVVDLGPFALQPLTRPDKTYLDDAGQYLERVAPNERTFFLRRTDPSDADPVLWSDPGSNLPVFFYRVQSVGGPHEYSATHVLKFMRVMTGQLLSDLSQVGTLSAPAQTYAALMNITRYAVVGRTGMGMPDGLGGTAEEFPLGRIARIPNATPVIFAPRLVSQTDLTAEQPAKVDGDRYQTLHRFVDQVIASMHLDLPRRRARFISVQQLPKGDLAASVGAVVPQSEDQPLEILAYSVAMQEIQLSVRVPEKGYLRLAHAWYPYLRVRVDGEDVQPLKSSLGFLVVPVDGGTHAIDVVPVQSSVRRLTAWIAIGTLVVVWLVAAMGNRRLRRASTGEVAA